MASLMKMRFLACDKMRLAMAGKGGKGLLAASKEMDMAGAAGSKSIESFNNKKMPVSPSSSAAVLQDFGTSKRPELVFEALATTVVKHAFSKEMWPETRDIIAPLVDKAVEQAKNAIKTTVAVVAVSFLVVDTSRAVVSKKGFTYKLGKKVSQLPVLQG